MYGPQTKKALRIIQRALQDKPNENDERVVDLRSVPNIHTVPLVPEGIHVLNIQGMKNVKGLSSLPSTLKYMEARVSFDLLPKTKMN